MHPMRSLQPPPRRVPLSLWLTNVFNAASQGGWAFFGFGMIFFWVFALQADLSFATFRNATGRADGRVLHTRKTGASENEQQVHASHYQYSVAGRTFEGTSYTTGGAPAQGDSVEVEFDEGNPGRSRIAGMRRAPFGPGVLFVLLFPAIGLVWLYLATRSGFRRNRLLAQGILAQGTLKNMEETNVRINGRPVYALTFEFIDRRGQRQKALARMTDPDRLRDDATEPLLYDPENPSRAYLLDELPARPSVEQNGDLAGRAGVALAVLILPAIVIGAHALLVLWRL
jgi:hypothetical protein